MIHSNGLVMQTRLNVTNAWNFLYWKLVRKKYRILSPICFCFWEAVGVLFLDHLEKYKMVSNGRYCFQMLCTHFETGASKIWGLGSPFILVLFSSEWGCHFPQVRYLFHQNSSILVIFLASMRRKPHIAGCRCLLNNIWSTKGWWIRLKDVKWRPSKQIFYNWNLFQTL